MIETIASVTLGGGEFAAALRDAGYDGVVSLECFSDALRAEPADAVAREGLDALRALWSGTSGTDPDAAPAAPVERAAVIPFRAPRVSV